MRIIAGRHRGRRLIVPEGSAVRPTSERAREALFNILAHDGVGTAAALAGGTVLDAFAGTGAFGLEALSRGAGQAIFIESGRAALAALRHNVAALGETARSRIIAADACAPPIAPAPAALGFLDPPYDSSLAAGALAALARAGWLGPGALAVIEIAAQQRLAAPAGFACLEERRYGAARFVFLRFTADMP